MHECVCFCVRNVWLDEDFVRLPLLLPVLTSCLTGYKLYVRKSNLVNTRSNKWLRSHCVRYRYSCLRLSYSEFYRFALIQHTHRIDLILWVYNMVASSYCLLGHSWTHHPKKQVSWRGNKKLGTLLPCRIAGQCVTRSMSP